MRVGALAALAFAMAVAMAAPAATQSQTTATTTRKAPPPTVLWYAPFLSGGGYCSEAHSYVAAIDDAVQALHQDEHEARESHGHAVAGAGSDEADGARAERPFGLFITQHGDSYSAAFIRDMPDEMRDVLEQHWIEERDFHWRLKDTAIALAICHSEPGAWHPAHYKTSRCPPEEAQYKVGRTMFETDRVPSGWPDRMNLMDEIWVPTKFQQKIFVDGGVRADAVHVLPEAVDVHFFDPSTVDEPYDLASEITRQKVTEKTTVFLSVFKWEERKGWKVLLKAYFQAFSAKDDVVLVILTSAYHTATESAADFMAIIDEFAKTELQKSLRELPLVHVMPPQIPQPQLPSLYKAATCFVLPSRGEGWGRPHVEAMAMGLPIISTFWSGTTEYMTEKNSYPLSIDGLVEIQEGAFRGHKWAEPSTSHLTELLQRVHQFPEEAREKGKRAREDMVSKYAPEVIGKVLLGHIERVLAIVAARQQEAEEVEPIAHANAEESHDEL